MGQPIITKISHTLNDAETDAPVFHAVFSNFVEYPAPKEPVGALPYLYFTLGVKCLVSGVGFLFHDVRLTGGKFQNPYHKTQWRSRAHGYLNPFAAQAVEKAWVEAVSPLLPRWKLSEGAWEGLVFNVEKLSKSMDAPYKVWTKEKAVEDRKRRAIEKVGIV